MKIGYIFLILVISFSLYAEDEAPSTIELIIPTVIVEFEDRSEQIMELIVPDYKEIVLPDFEIVLPDPGEIPIGEIDFDLPLPGLIEYNYSEGSPFFSEGTLGIGNRNHLVGNVSLFRLGDGPRFSVLFAHNGLDGFGSHSAGKSFFSRREALEGDFRIGDELFMVSGSGSFRENEDGLQQQVLSHTSVIHRLSSVTLTSAINGKLEINAGLGLNIAGKTLTGETPVFAEELVLSAQANLGWQKNWFRIELDNSYAYDRLKQNNTIENIINSNLILGFTLNTLDIKLSGGLFWIPGTLPDYPFSAAVAGAFKDFLQYQFSGGYQVENYLNFEPWNNYPLLGTGYGKEEGWFCDGRITISPFSEVNFGIQWLYRKMSNIITADLNAFDASTGMFPMVSGSGLYLDVSPFIRMTNASGLSISLGLKSQLLSGIDELKPAHAVRSELEYINNRFGMFLNGELSLNPFVQVPEIAFGVNYEVGDGVVLSLEGGDILGFFSEDRISYNNYIKEGGTVTLLTKISL